MELKEFTKKAIQDIVTSIIEVQQDNPNITIRPCEKGSGDHRTIEFDIAVSAENESTGGAGVGIKVLTFTAGGETSGKTKNSTVSRIQFGVHVAIPNSTKEMIYHP